MARSAGDGRDGCPGGPFVSLNVLVMFIPPDHTGDADKGNPPSLAPSPAGTSSPGLRFPRPPGGETRNDEETLMRGIGGSTLRGGQTVFHGLRMWGQLFRAAMLFAAFTTVAVPAWTLWHRTTGAEWYAAGMATLAEVKLVLGYDPDSGQEIRFADGTRRTLRIRDIAASAPALEAREKHPGRDVRERGARRAGGRRADRAVPGRVLVARRAARAAEAHPGRRDGDGRGAPPPAAIAPCAAADARCRAASGCAPIRSPASRIRSGPRPSTPSSRAPPAPARRC